MRFIYEQSIHAQFFKGDNIILSGLVIELVEFQLNGAFALFHLLDGEAFCIGAFCFGDTLNDLVELCLQDCSLPIHTHGDLLKLRVSDNDCIVIARGNTGAELFAVSRFKVFLRCHKDIGRRIQLQKLRCPLFGQVIWNHEQALLTESKAFTLHSGSNHLEGLACTHNVRKQRVTAVQDAGNGIYLMFPQGNFGVHANELDVASVILTGTNGIELFVVERGQAFPSCRIFPYPVSKSILDELLLLLCKHGLLLVQYSLIIAVFILHSIKNTNIFEIQRFLNDLVTIDSLGTVGHVCGDIAVVAVLARDIPLCGQR